MIGIKVKTLLLFLFAASLLAGQNSHPHFRNYSTNDGLPSSEVYTAFEDSKGYIWFGTDNGVSRFNGYEFENFGVKEGLMDNVVFHIREDKAGRVWMNTLSGKLFYYWDDFIHPFTYNHLIEQYKGDFLVSSGFFIEENGDIYTALYGLGILKIDTAGNGVLLNEQLNTAAFMVDFGEELLSVLISKPNLSKAFLQERNAASQIAISCLKDSVYHSFQLPKSTIYRSNFKAIKHEEHYIIVLGERLSIIDDQFNLKKALPFSEVISDFSSFPSGVLWIGLQKGGGVKRFASLDALLKNQFHRYLPGNAITNLIQDRTGGLWMPSLESGIYHCPSRNFEIFDEQIGLNSSVVTALTPKSEDSFIMGLRNGEIYEYIAAEKNIVPSNTGSIADELHDLLYDPQTGYLWNGGTWLNYWNGKKWVSVKDTFEVNMKSTATKNLFLASPGQDQLLWGCHYKGFNAIDPISGKTVYSSRPDIPFTRTLCFLIDVEGKKWVGTVSGLFEFKNHQLHPPALNHPFFKTRIEALQILSNGAKVLGSKGEGIAIWSDNESPYIISEKNGLLSNMVEHILIDSLDQIWVSTVSGLNKVSLTPEMTIDKVEQITIAHGLPSNEINDILAFKGRIWLATPEGLVSIPQQLQSNQVTHSPVLKEALVNNQKTNPATIDHYPYQSNNWQFSFFSPNYKFPGKIPYRYRIQPGEDWTVTTNNVINFAKLAPGVYQFEIQAQNEDGFWSESLLLPFTINTPFWMSLWFAVLLVSSLIAWIIIVFQRRVNRIQHEAKIQQEINALKRAALQAQMNPHFIFNCLNSIQQFIALDDKKNALHYLSRFAQLIRSTLNASLKTKIPLEEEIEMLKNYLELEKTRFVNRFDFHISVDEAIETFELEIPPLLIQPYVENAIIHGLANVDRKGKLDIDYRMKEGLLMVTITDNGVGIFHSQQQKKDKADLRTSLGMGITKKRLNLIQAKGASDREVQIIERKNPAGKVIGTTIKLHIGL